MAKGAAIRFKSYEETVPKLLELMKLQNELKKYDKIVLKPILTENLEKSTPKEFVESVLKFCLAHKNPVSELFIAEGADGFDTEDLFNSLGYKGLAERYNISLIDLNNTDTEEISDYHFTKFTTIQYPKILKEAFIISLPKIVEDEELVLTGSTSSMLGAFPSSHYKGFFSTKKNKIRKWPIKYSVHDILRCKMPSLAVADLSARGVILAGLPIETDKQSAKLYEKDWKTIPHLVLVDEAFSNEMPEVQK